MTCNHSIGSNIDSGRFQSTAKAALCFELESSWLGLSLPRARFLHSCARLSHEYWKRWCLRHRAHLFRILSDKICALIYPFDVNKNNPGKCIYLGKSYFSTLLVLTISAMLASVFSELLTSLHTNLMAIENQLGILVICYIDQKIR